MVSRKGVYSLAVVLALCLLVPVAMAEGGPHKANLAIPVTGTFTNAAGTGNFAGTFTLQRFATQNGHLYAVGLLTGTLTDATGMSLGSVLNNVSLPVDTDPSCSILNLTLGPLDLNLLGLMVHLNQVVLNITAQPGAGNLLGNLLCSVANLLNGGGSLTAITNLLNQILGVLSGLGL